MLFITNAHVVAKGDVVTITGPRFPAVMCPVRVLGMAKEVDIAVLAVSRPRDDDEEEFLSTLEPLKMRPELRLDLEEGTAVGFPLGFTEITTSTGNVGPQVFNGRIVYQISESLNGGNSGGGLFDEKGYWRGVPYAGIMFVSDLSFCITDMEAIEVARAIVRGNIAAQGEVVEVEPLQINVPFELLPGDRIHQDLVMVEGPNQPLAVFQDEVTGTLEMCMRLLPPGDYTVVRDGQVLDLDITTRYNWSVLTPTNPIPFVMSGPIHMTSLAKAHMAKFPSLYLHDVSNPAVIITAADPKAKKSAFVGALVKTVNGRIVQTPGDVADALEDNNNTFETTEGTLIV